MTLQTKPQARECLLYAPQPGRRNLLMILKPGPLNPKLLKPATPTPKLAEPLLTLSRISGRARPVSRRRRPAERLGFVRALQGRGFRGGVQTQTEKPYVPVSQVSCLRLCSTDLLSDNLCWVPTADYGSSHNRCCSTGLLVCRPCVIKVEHTQTRPNFCRHYKRSYSASSVFAQLR